jgi:hypothetical protein
MGKTKHEESFVDFDKPYEQNIIGMRGIIYFAVGLFLLIVVTFGLMWVLQNVMEDQAKLDKDKRNPLGLTDKERLPPEPRLQGAPGFGVESPNGRVNLELKAPQSEWWEMQKQYKELWEKGQKTLDATGKEVIVTLPISDAKEKFLSESGKTVNTAADEISAKSRMIISDSSAGRVASEKRR